MKITTSEFSLDQKDHFKILIINGLTRRWFLFVIFFVISGMGTKLTLVSILAHFMVFVLMSAMYLLYLVTRCAVKSWLLKSNQFLFSPQRCEIDSASVAAYLTDGSLIKMNFSYITKIVARKEYFLFYYASNQFIYLPLNAISNPADVQALRTIIQVKSG